MILAVSVVPRTSTDVPESASAAAGAVATAIVAIMAEAEAKPTSRRLVMRLDMLSSDWTRGWLLTSRILIEGFVRSHRTVAQNDRRSVARLRQRQLVQGEAGSGGRIRTYDQVINSHPLYH